MVYRESFQVQSNHRTVTFHDVTAQVKEIAAKAVTLPPDERKINSKEDYHETWFRSNL